MLHPESRFRVGWDLLMLTLLIYVAVLVPLATFFSIGHSSAHLVWDGFVDLAFLVDMVLANMALADTALADMALADMALADTANRFKARLRDKSFQNKALGQIV